MPTIINGRVTYKGGESMPAVGSVDYNNAVKGKITSTSSKPVEAAPAEKTVGEVYGTYKAPSPDEIIKAPKNDVDEGSIRRNVMAMFQKEIDATNQIYAEKLNEARKQGLGRLGSSSAILARSGNIGSPGGEAVYRSVEDENTAGENLIRQEKSAKISEIVSRARAEADAEIENKRRAQKEGYDSYISYLDKRSTQKESSLKKLAVSLLDSKLAPEKLTPKELQEIADSYGVSTSDIIASYNTEKKSRDDVQAKLDSDAAKTKFDQDMEQKKFELDQKYKNGSLSLDEYRAETERLKAGLDANGQPIAATGTQNTVDQIKFLKSTVAEAKALSGASGASGVAKKAGDFFVGDTDYRRLEAKTNTLRTNVMALMTDPSIKKFFGPQMSNADVQLMTSAGTTLNPENNSPEDMQAELVRLEELFNRMERALVVTIRKPDGTTGTIPRANLEAALQLGAVQI